MKNLKQMSNKIKAVFITLLGFGFGIGFVELLTSHSVISVIMLYSLLIILLVQTMKKKK
jgi:uncharacterized membrane protein YccC